MSTFRPLLSSAPRKWATIVFCCFLRSLARKRCGGVCASDSTKRTPSQSIVAVHLTLHCIYIYIVWTRAYTCTEQSRAECSGSEHSVAEPSTFE